MKVENVACMCAGVLIGLAVTFYEADPIPSGECFTYKIRQKIVTAYVLKPPPPIVEKEFCPPAPKCEMAKPKENLVEEKINSDDDRKPKRKRKRYRIRRYWR